MLCSSTARADQKHRMVRKAVFQVQLLAQQLAGISASTNQDSTKGKDMKLSKQEAQEVIYGDSEDWKKVTLQSVTDTSRWSIYYTQVFQHIPTGKLYEFNWSSGATEQQDEAPFEYQDTYEPTEVVATEKLVTVYEPVKEPPK